MAGNFVFSPGTVVTWQKWNTGADPWTLVGTPATLKGAKSISGGARTRTVADVTTLQDSTVARLPVKYDLGTVSLTLNQLDDADTTNEHVALNNAWEAGDMLQIIVDLPGDWDKNNNNTVTYNGFINSISNPEVSVSDEPLSYTVELTLVLPHILPGA